MHCGCTNLIAVLSEPFHACLKREEVNLVTYYGFNAVKLSIFEYIKISADFEFTLSAEIFL